MLEKIVRERWLSPRAVVGFWPSNAETDDILIYDSKSRDAPPTVFQTLRQQMSRESNKPNLALADFVTRARAARADYLGGFVVTTGHGEEAHIKRFEADKDDYSAILLRAARRPLAKPLRTVARARRREFWAYAPDENFTCEELIAESYRGIRPAPGYPPSPTYGKGTLFTLLDAERRIGVKLTESFAMWPASSISGLYFSHPESRYFGIGKIERDQVEDYARRKHWSVKEAERWLRAAAKLRSRAAAA